MRGTKHIHVRFRKIEYDLSFDRNVSVLKGHGGTGKTTLINAIYDWKHSELSQVKLSANCDVDVLTQGTDYEKVINTAKNTLFFADEGVSYICRGHFADIFYKSGNYLVIVGRSGFFDLFDYALGSVYYLKTSKSGEKYVTVQANRYINNDISISPDVIITEDSKVGNKVIKSVINCNVVSANGKDSVPNKISELSIGSNYVYAIVDGAAYGSVMSRTYQLLSDRVFLFAPESFEYLCLSCEPLRSKVSDILLHTSDFVDAEKYISWERFFIEVLKDKIKDFGETYSKSGSIPILFRSERFKSQFKNLLVDLKF